MTSMPTVHIGDSNDLALDEIVGELVKPTVEGNCAGELKRLNYILLRIRSYTTGGNHFTQ